MSGGGSASVGVADQTPHPVDERSRPRNVEVDPVQLVDQQPVEEGAFALDRLLYPLLDAAPGHEVKDLYALPLPESVNAADALL